MDSDRQQDAADPAGVRRWPIWLARMGMTGLVAVSYPAGHAVLSDNLARQLLIAVATIAALLLAPFLRWSHETVYETRKIPEGKLARAVVTFAASCVAIGVFLRGAQADAVDLAFKYVHPPRRLSPAAGGTDGTVAAGIHHDDVALLPRFSSKLNGTKQAPISLIFLGSGVELLEAFIAAGWFAAERITPRTCLRAFGRGVLNRPYFSAPVLPGLMEGKLHDVAFQKTDDGGSSRRRHHARWWLTDFECEGKQVWVATASYDAGVGICRVVPLPIHHIHPDLDAERDFIAGSLTAAGYARVVQEVRVSDPVSGRNSAGDHYYTQGMALVLA